MQQNLFAVLFWAQYGFNLKKLTCARNYGQKLSA